jgi:hypothetical protein
MLFHRFPVEYQMDLLSVIYRYNKRNFNKDIPTLLPYLLF